VSRATKVFLVMVLSEPEFNRIPTPEVEVSSKPKRRRFTAEYKRKILAEAATCTERGAMGALLRREGLYSSHLSEWRAAAARGEIAGLAPKRRGPAPRVRDPRDKQIAELERRLARAERRAERAEGLVELQKKVSELLGIQLPENDEKNS
jgi:transposase-like protein